jgi:PAS domain S-box-containing protein
MDEGARQPAQGTGDLDFFRLLVEQAPYGAVVSDTALDGAIHYVNPEFTALTGYRREDVPTVADWLERAYPEPEYRRYVLDGWPRDTDPEHMRRDVHYRVQCRDGAQRYFRLRAAPLGRGRMLVSMAAVADWIDEQRRRLEVEERNRALVDHVPLGIVVHSAGRIDFANPHALRLVGAERPEDLLGEPVMRFVHPDSRAVVAARLRDLYGKAASGPPLEERFVRLDGTPIDVEVTATFVDFAGRPASLVLVSDITERKRAEAERRSLEARVQQAQKLESLGILAGGVAHDFNNLLVSILGRTELARLEVPPDSPAHAHLGALDAAAHQAADLARQMLAYAGQGRFDVRRLDLNAALTEMRRLVEASVSHRATLRWELADGLAPIAADTTQFRQVLLNLVTNASEALAGGHGVVVVRSGAAALDALAGHSVSTGLAPEPGDYVFLEVEDTGVGMDAAACTRMFDPFYSTKFTGRGLGLAAVLGIVRGHRGTIDVQSSPGVGTRLRVYFPAAPGAVDAAPKEARDVQEWRASGTVLVVDDDASVLDVAGVMLRRMGFTVATATDGLEALAHLKSGATVDLVLLDLTMPRLDGEQTLTELRRTHAELPVLLSSGYGETDVARRIQADPATRFVGKPYTYRGLLAAVREALGAD